MTQLQRDKTFEPSGVQGKLKIVLHDVSGTLIRALVPPGRSNADMMER